MELHNECYSFFISVVYSPTDSHFLRISSCNLHNAFLSMTSLLCSILVLFYLVLLRLLFIPRGNRVRLHSVFYRGILLSGCPSSDPNDETRSGVKQVAVPRGPSPKQALQSRRGLPLCADISIQDLDSAFIPTPVDDVCSSIVDEVVASIV